MGGAGSGFSAWATRGADRIDRVVLIDKDPSRAERITLRPPAGTPPGATLERLQAESVYSRSGVTLGGRTYGRETSTGELSPAITQTLTPGPHGGYTITVPAASAALVTFGTSAAHRRQRGG